VSRFWGSLQIAAATLLVWALAGWSCTAHEKQFSAVTTENGISISASLWPYESLCDLPEPVLPVKESSAEVNTTISGPITITGCHDLEKKWGKPTAVRIHVVNSGNAEAEFVLKGLAGIRLVKSTGTAEAAIGLQLRTPSPSGGSTLGIANEFEGSITHRIPPGAGHDLVVLFKDAEEGDSVVIGEGKPVRIAK